MVRGWDDEEACTRGVKGAAGWAQPGAEVESKVGSSCTLKLMGVSGRKVKDKGWNDPF